MTDTVRVLLVEDETVILELLQAALEDGGFAVEALRSGTTAMAAIGQAPLQCSALVTDVEIERGGPTGWDVAKRARELIPDLPVIYMTGARGHEWSANGVPNSILLTKPFAPAQVVTAVSQLLNGASSSKGP
jgi:DNA-binding NtrC family response regulator